ncbi:MAG TPA: GIY-YIG nuclease family protein [Ktedonobacteraceae bacterium]|nr:GIY-YIG nuclease family protein [Ktedonobacteraceae bacterium]
MGYRKYYVYTLAYPDGNIFYVGKGQGNRIDQHEEEARRYRSYPKGVWYAPKESAKIRAILEIWQTGGKVLKAIVFETDSEQEANDYEKQLIAQCDQRYLTNQTKGGGPLFSQRDPYARLGSHRKYYYTPQEAREKLGVSEIVWGRLILAGVLQLWRVEGCSYSVLHRQDIDILAEKIKDGTYPISVWEGPASTKKTSTRESRLSSSQTEKKPSMSRIEMQQEAAAFALNTACQTISPSCLPIGSYEHWEGDELMWKVYIQTNEKRLIYVIKLQQDEFLVANVADA